MPKIIKYLSPSRKSGFECAHVHGEKDYFTPNSARERNAELLAVLEDAAKLSDRLGKAQAMINDLHARHEALKQAARVFLSVQTTAAMMDLEHVLERSQTVVNARGVSVSDMLQDVTQELAARSHISNLESIYGCPAIRVGYQPLHSTKGGTPPGAE